MALSAVYRSGQKFGSQHIIDILRGLSSEKITQHGHQSLSTFGIGKSLSETEWRSILRQLTARGYLDVDQQGYGSLLLNERCRPLLRGEESIELRKEVPTTTSKPQAAKHLADLDPQTLPLWFALKACRKRLAEEAGVPPYLVFHDSTLKEMLRSKPRTAQQLGRINGIGDSKLKKYGQAFLDTLNDFD
jgi:ATP-dependent DNA helicase RecQ